MKQIYSTLLLATLTFTACGGGGGGSAPQENTPSIEDSSSLRDENSQVVLSPAKTQYYEVEAIPTAGNNCRGASGKMIINDTNVSGSIETGWGDMLTIEGTHTPKSGEISGGFAKNGIRLVAYSGKIVDNNATGKWEDNYGCSGTWSGVGHKLNFIPVGISVDPHHLEGYSIKYSQKFPEYFFFYDVVVDCDGSYDITSMREDYPGSYFTQSGSTIHIYNDRISFELLANFTLIDGKLVTGISKETNFNSFVYDISKVKECK